MCYFIAKIELGPTHSWPEAAKLAANKALNTMDLADRDARSTDDIVRRPSDGGPMRLARGDLSARRSVRSERRTNERERQYKLAGH